MGMDVAVDETKHFWPKLATRNELEDACPQSSWVGLLTVQHGIDFVAEVLRLTAGQPAQWGSADVNKASLLCLLSLLELPLMFLLHPAKALMDHGLPPMGHDQHDVEQGVVRQANRVRTPCTSLLLELLKLV